jgi:D-alanyl-D-alanine carboxypeptidase
MVTNKIATLMIKKLCAGLIFLLIHISFLLHAQGKEIKIQDLLDSLRLAGNYPGLSVAISTDYHSERWTSGYNSVENNIPLKSTDMFLTGSVGKTYVAAIAIQLIEKKQLNLDSKVKDILGTYSWYDQLPNANDITVKMLLNHTSGIMRYEFKESFTADLTANPDKVWKPAELVSYVLNEQPAFKAGEGWEYSDTNYILLGMIIEKITGQPYYALLKRNILKPYKLTSTKPSVQRKLKGLVQGYASKENVFGGDEKMINENGELIINPQFEWTGGGIYSTAEDLARWGKILYEGNAFGNNYLAEMLNGVPATLGKDVKYGLGVIVRSAPLGITYGHSGFFPGYLAELVYFPNHRISIALLGNSSDVKSLKLGLNRMAHVLAKAIIDKNP